MVVSQISVPSWPALCVGNDAVRALARSRRLSLRIAAIVIILFLAGHGMRFAARNGPFPSGEGDHRYATNAKLVEQATDPPLSSSPDSTAGNQVLRRRTIVRFDLLDPAWLDRAILWLTQQGRRPYFLLEEWEMDTFQTRFASQSALGRLTIAPVMEYRAPGVPGPIYLFDPALPDGGALHSVPPAATRAKCVAPSPLLHLK